MTIELNAKERLILRNQYELLYRLSEKKDERNWYQTAIEIVEWGYEANYEDLFPSADDRLTPEECMFVINVLRMYEKITEAVEKLGVKPPEDINYWAKFRGFHESKYIRYARFLIEKEGKFSSFDHHNLDSHHGTVGKYQNMVCIFESLQSQKNYEQLSEEDLKHLFERVSSGQEN
jgi:uncharacterized protein YfbU (UPF0304 family)